MNRDQDISRFHFLVVEDDDFQREVLVMLLTNLGAKHILQAENGRAALQLLSAGEQTVDIILSDLDMPEMDGMTFIRHLGERKHKASIILVSGLSGAMLESVETMSGAYGIKTLGIMHKPVSRSRLMALIAKHDSDRVRRNTLSNELLPQDELDNALTKGEIIPYFQPKVDMASGKVVGVEALARWNSPTRGLLTPDAFLESIEFHGLMDKLTWVMLAKSAAICRRWQEQGLPLLVSINLSLSSLGRLELAERIFELVSKQGLDPSAMILEVTETATMADVGHCLENLARLRLRGFGLSIDDYGTGYSSLQQLTRVPFTELKIDQTFVRDAVHRESARIVVESSLDIARKLGLHATAEGVESIEHWDMLKGMGCNIAQGYLIARPMEEAAIPDWVARWKGISSIQTAAPVRQGVHILLVEDEDFQRETYAEMLEQMKLGQVRTAKNIDVALQRMSETTYGLIITDVDLGGRTGLDLVKLIRTCQTPASPATRVIVLSSHGEQDVVLRTISLDINGFLAKPATPHALYDAIQEAMAEEFNPQPAFIYQNLTEKQESKSYLSASIMRPERTPLRTHRKGNKHVTLDFLRTGMVLAEPIYSKENLVVLNKGHKLTPSVINRLQDIQVNLATTKIWVIPPS